MKQYTTEWAKEYLREHLEVGGIYIFAIAQDNNGSVYAYKNTPFTNNGEWLTGYYTKGERIEHMLEHPDGWEKSKVTREDI